MSAPKAPPHLPELLAPAGDWDAMRAAVANGANAVYFGLPNFNARHRATNFSLAELPTVMDYLHRHNVRGYVAFNTLIFSDELHEAVEFVAAIAAAGVDAVIVQDLGLVRLIHAMAPGLAIHGSTQMTLTEPRGIELVRQLGVDRVILARELSLPDIEQISARTPMPLEVFVHGALCVAYSGQCLTSEALGGRSANRGQCAQACRLPYEMIVDGKPRDTGDVQYLLSPQDLAAHDLIADLLRLGVASFKIEGRLKSAEYVAIASQSYRAAIDAAVASEPFALDRQRQLDLQQSFSRGFSHGFLAGVNHQELVPGRFPKSRGVRIGTVIDKTARGVVVQLDEQHADANQEDITIVKPGDGVVFDEGHPEQDEQGGRIVAVQPFRRVGLPRALAELELFHGSVNLSAIAIGSLVWKTDDPAMRGRLQQSFSRDVVVHRRPLDFVIEGTIGGEVRLKTIDSAGRDHVATWLGPLQVAEKHPVTLELLREQLGRLGETPFELGTIDNRLPPTAMVPKSVLNDLRRQVLAKLVSANERAARVECNREAAAHLLSEVRSSARRSDVDFSHQAPRLYVLARTMDQLDALLAWDCGSTGKPLAMVYCDFEDVRRYREAVAKARAAGVPIGLATLRIVKPGEEGLLRQIAKAEPDAVLIRNLAALSFFGEEKAARASRRDAATGGATAELIGDYSLNVANELTANLLSNYGLSRLVPSYDLNWEQLSAMLGRCDAGRCEVVVHQHMPMFHMEHCAFAAMLSDGKDWRDCGRPCDHHRVELRDRVGAEFPLLADTGCRNTVFNSVPQSAAEYVPKILSLGVRHFRVELLRESPDQVAPLVENYLKLLAGEAAPGSAWRGLQVLNQLGVTRGTLANREL